MEYPGRKAQYSQWEAVGATVRQETPEIPVDVDRETRLVKILLGFMLAGFFVEFGAEAIKYLAQ